MQKKDDRTADLLARMAKREVQQLDTRKKRLTKAIAGSMKRLTAADCKEIEDVLFPILGRLQVVGE